MTGSHQGNLTHLGGPNSNFDTYALSEKDTFLGWNQEATCVQLGETNQTSMTPSPCQIASPSIDRRGAQRQLELQAVLLVDAAQLHGPRPRSPSTRLSNGSG